MPNDTCAYDPECPRPVMARGLCNTHYVRANRAGELHKWTAPPRPCQLCGKPFAVTKHRKTYCGPDCFAVATEARRVAERLTRNKGRTCRQCGSDIPATFRSDATSCSIQCQQAQWYEQNQARLRAAARDWARGNRVKRAEYELRRRAKMRGFAAERVDPLAVWERDAGICYLCLKPVSLDKMSPHPDAPSLDHVVALSRGGPHNFANLALAHLRCNIRKSDGLPRRYPKWFEGGDLPLEVAS